MGFNRNTNESITTKTNILETTNATVIGLSIAPTAGNATVSVQLNDTYIVKDLVVLAGTSSLPIGGSHKLVVLDTDILSVTSDNTVDVITSYLEN
jgi:hypothetical protein